MPAILPIELLGDPPPTPFVHAGGLRALTLCWIGADQPGVADALHDFPGLKPYTIGPLRRTARGARCELGVCVDWLLPLLLAGIEHTRDEEIRLGRQSFRLVEMPMPTRQVAWEELMAPAAPGESRWSFHLHTPTALHRTGTENRIAVVLPDPVLYFGNWLRRWNLCAPCAINEGLLAFVEEHIAVAYCAGETREVILDGARRVFVGFTGEVTFAAVHPRALTSADRTALATLARFATYAGTGVETMRGMGQTSYTSKRNHDRYEIQEEEVFNDG